MSQRIYQVSKIFAILVFSFEILAPAFISGNTHHKETATRIIEAASNTQNQLYYLIAEEFSASEEDGEGNKEYIPIFDFNLVSVFNSYLVESAAQSLMCYFQPITDGVSHLPLFLFNCIFLI